MVGVLGGLKDAPACWLWRMIDEMSATGRNMIKVGGGWAGGVSRLPEKSACGSLAESELSLEVLGGLDSIHKL